MSKWQNKSLIWDVAGILIILGIEIFLTYDRGMHGIDLHHMPVIADGGYRVYSGQLPYRDFHIPIGPMVYWIQSFFFFIEGGFFWKAIALHAAVAGAVATLLIYIILRLYLGSMVSLIFASVAALTFYYPRAFPWYDQTAFIFYLIALASFCIANKYSKKLSTSAIYGLAALSGLGFMAAMFSKHNIGLAAFVLTAPLWFISSFNERDHFTDRTKRFFTCISFFLLSMVFLAFYFNFKGDFLADITKSTGQMNRLSLLLPNAAFDRWINHGYGAIVLLIYTSVAILIAGICYLLRFRVKTIFQDRGPIGAVISLAVVIYLTEMSSLSGPYTAYALFSLLLGLLYFLLLKLEQGNSVMEFDRRRFSNFCLVMSLGSMLLFVLWGLTSDKPYISSRSIVDDRWFMKLTLIITVFFLTLGLLARIFKKTPWLSLRYLFSGHKVYVVFLAVSLVAYYDNTDMEYLPVKYMVRKVLLPGTVISGHQFNRVPALEGVYADKNTINSIEKLYAWFRPKLEADPSLKDGTEVYVFPQGQSLYGILGVESFRNAYLWLHYKLTYDKLDPDTAIIINRTPEFIIMYSADRNFMVDRMPKLHEFIRNDYILAVTIDDFLVFQNKDKRKISLL